MTEQGSFSKTGHSLKQFPAKLVKSVWMEHNHFKRMFKHDLKAKY